MTKDPAFLFYSSDFLTGTFTMSDEQVGKYIRLLCLQHQKGELTEKDMLNICKSHDEDIFNKFQSRNGMYFNTRLKEEIEKRVKYSESRSNNRKKKVICESHDEHMENENENNNENESTSSLLLSSSPENLFPGINKPVLLSFEKSKIELENSYRLKESIQKTFGISDYQYKEALKFFLTVSEEEYPRTIKETSTHFRNWVNKNIKIIRENSFKTEKSFFDPKPVD